MTTKSSFLIRWPLTVVLAGVVLVVAAWAWLQQPDRQGINVHKEPAFIAALEQVAIGAGFEFQFADSALTLSRERRLSRHWDHPFSSELNLYVPNIARLQKVTHEFNYDGEDGAFVVYTSESRTDVYCPFKHKCSALVTALRSFTTPLSSAQ